MLEGQWSRQFRVFIATTGSTWAFINFYQHMYGLYFDKDVLDSIIEKTNKNDDLLESVQDFLEAGKELVEILDVQKELLHLTMSNKEQILQLLSEMAITRCVAAFQYYLSQILIQVLVKYPDLLAGLTPKQKRTSELNEATINEKAENAVSRLTRSGIMRGIVNYFNNPLGLCIDTSSDLFFLCQELMQVRNVIAHNAGKINKSLLNRERKNYMDQLKEGDLFPVNENRYTPESIIQLVRFASMIDTKIQEKYPAVIQ